MYKLTEITLHNLEPLGSVPTFQSVGPPISENASSFNRSWFSLALTPEILEHDSPTIMDTMSIQERLEFAIFNRDFTAENVVITNLDGYGRMMIEFDLATILATPSVEINLYFGKTEEVNDNYLLTTPVVDEPSLRLDRISAYGDIGPSVAIGAGKTVVIDASFGIDRNPPYDELVLTTTYDDVTRLLAYIYYPITLENIGEKARLAF